MVASCAGTRPLFLAVRRIAATASSACALTRWTFRGPVQRTGEIEISSAMMPIKTSSCEGKPFVRWRRS